MSRKDKIVFLNSEYNYGFHVQKYPTLLYTVERVAKELPFNTFQIYAGNPRSSGVRDIEVSDIVAARHALYTYDLKMFFHSCLTHNLCGAAKHRQDPMFLPNLKKTCDGLTNELDIAAGLDCGGVVVHPNSCHDAKKGIYTAIKTIESVLTRNTALVGEISRALKMNMEDVKKNRKLLLENSAHEGGKRGWNLEELRDMIHGTSENIRDQVGVCLDTAHAFGAGIYDFGKVSHIKKFYKDFDNIIGLKYLKLFHLNDSMHSDEKRSNAYFGSKKDRHQNLGLGWIFSDDVGEPLENTKDSRMDGLQEFFRQARIRNIPVIGEPPASSYGGIYDWGVVRDLLSNSSHPLEYIYSTKV